MQQVNITSIKTSSDGAWQGDNPLNYAFPLLIVQTTLVLAISHLLAFILKPFRQPKVIAEILGGILLGPSALGRNKYFLNLVFPSWGTPILESVASIGLLFFLFLVGLELDLSSIHKTGKRALIIAFVGISLPFASGAGVTSLLHHLIGHESTPTGYGQTLLFMGVSLSITAFPVLARILAELKLLTTQVGETAMAAAAFNDVVAWVLLALAIAISGGHKGPLTPLWVLASGAAFVGFMVAVVRPAMGWVANKCSPEEPDTAYIGLTLAGAMLSGFMTDLIGIHAVFGSFVFGLIIPKQGEFAGRLVKRIEDFVSTLLLPLYFASSGLKTDVTKIRGAGAWAVLAIVISTACTGKILGTFLVAMLCMIPARESLTLGLLMNTKGLVELIILNIGKEKKVLNDEMFAILVLMALFTTLMTTPAVMAIYKPKQVPDHQESKDDHGCIRIVSCVHGSDNVPSIISLIELMRGAQTCCLKVKLYGVHLVELTESSSSILMVHRARRNGRPFVKQKGNSSRHPVAVAFEACAKGIQPSVAVRATTAISDLPTMHEDICHLAKKKRASMVILPFHKQYIVGWNMVNQRVLQDAPCSVAVLVDRGFGGPCSDEGYSQRGGECTDPKKRICVLFFGGPDDRRALELGGKISERSMARVTVMHFTNEEEDDEAMKELTRSNSIEYMERISENVKDEVMEIGTSGAYDLIIVGKGSALKMASVDLRSEFPELGMVGGLLASSSHGIVSSVLVVQHHDLARKDEAPGWPNDNKI